MMIALCKCMADAEVLYSGALYCKRCAKIAATTELYIGAQGPWRDPCIFGGAIVGSEPVPAPVDRFAHLRQAMRAGKIRVQIVKIP